MGKFSQDPGYKAFRVLQFVFVVAPILAGLDKFFYVLTNWSQYLSPFAMKMVGLQAHGFFMMVGLVEIIVGIGVMLKPRVFSFVVSIWLGLIILNLVLTGMFFDIALRDLGLLLSAYALGLLSKKYAA